MYVYHLSYDVVNKPGFRDEDIPLSKSPLLNRFNEKLNKTKDGYCTPSVESTYYYCSFNMTSHKDVAMLIKKWFDDLCSEEEKRYFMIKLDVCNVNYPKYTYVIDGVDQKLKLNPTDTLNEFC